MTFEDRSGREAVESCFLNNILIHFFGFPLLCMYSGKMSNFSLVFRHRKGSLPLHIRSYLAALKRGQLLALKL